LHFGGRKNDDLVREIVQPPPARMALKTKKNV
jgi:hypothetical protein